LAKVDCFDLAISYSAQSRKRSRTFGTGTSRHRSNPDAFTLQITVSYRLLQFYNLWKDIKKPFIFKELARTF